MIRNRVAVVLALLPLCFCWCLTASAQTPRVVPGEYLMKIPGGTQRARTIQGQLGLEERLHNKLTNSRLVTVKAGAQFNHQLAKELIAAGVVEYLEPNYILQSFQNSASQQFTNDPEFSNLWGLHNTGQSGGSADVDIDAPEAWTLHRGNGSVVVGVVDSGIDYTHPDLSNRMWINSGEIPGNNFDDDGNGVVDDVYGYNAVSGNGNPWDDNGHGTHCAGTIGAEGNNGLGVSGAAWDVRLMALKFLDSRGFGSTQGAIEVIEYAVRMRQAGVNLRVLSNSWGGGAYSQALSDAIAAANNAGILFVVAAGNSSNDNDFQPVYPANYAQPNILSVAAIDHQGNLASFSNFGQTSVHLAAPGVSVYSTKPGGTYQYLSGTSMATPHVSGVAALLSSYDPSLTHLQLRDRLLRTVKPLATLQALVSTAGMVSANNALRNILAPDQPDVELPSYGYSTMSASPAPLGTRLLNVDDGYSEVWLPFEFPYYRRSYLRVAVSANGRVVPLAEGEALPTELDYSNRLTRAISPYHDDLFPSPTSASSGVWYHSAGDYVVFTWVVVAYGDRANTNPQAEMRFQARIYRNGLIEFHYLDTDAGNSAWSNGASATIGLAPGSGVSGETLLLGQNTADAQRFGSGRALRLYDNGSTPPGDQNPQPPTPPNPLPRESEADIDGDGKRDIIVWRPSTGYWFILGSATQFDFAQHRAYQHGLPGDIPKLGDFDDDGLADLAVWRPSNGTWYVRLSGSGYTSVRAYQWGLPGDQPLVGDYDGDGRDDLAVYRARAGVFYVLRSAGGFNTSAALRGSGDAYMAVPLGGPANDVVVGDFYGDGSDDFVTIWQLVRFWTLKDSAGNLRFSLPWGMPGDTPLACNFVTRSRDARVMVRVAADYTMQWFSVDVEGGVKTASFGSIGDTPLCDDHDNDGHDDEVVFRNHTGEWFIRGSSDAQLRRYQFGLPGDIPL